MALALPDLSNCLCPIQVGEAPRRASLRQRGVQADGAAVDTEGRGGHITLVNGEAIPYSDPSEPAQPRERHPPSRPLSVHSFACRLAHQLIRGALPISSPSVGLSVPYQPSPSVPPSVPHQFPISRSVWSLSAFPSRHV